MTDLPDVVERFLFADASIGVIILNADGTVRRANRFWQELSGRSLAAGDHLRDCLLELQPGFDLDAALASDGEPVMLNARASGPLPVTLYFRFYGDGDRIWAFAEHDQQEALQMRESLVNTNNELNNLSRELHKQRAQLERLNETKNHWLGMAAHDLRNPISVIRGMAGILQRTAEEKLSPKELTLLTRVGRSSQFMLGLIDDLLDVAKIESGKLELRRERQSLPAVVARAVELNRLIAEAKDIQIRFAPPTDFPQPRFDDQRIEQVLNNLLANAIKFSPPGTEVLVDLSSTEGLATVRVEDHGPGIPEAERDLLFRPFSRTSVTPTAGEKSTGLGLAIVRKVVAEHGGRTWAESEVGRGSAFFFALPLA